MMTASTDGRHVYLLGAGFSKAISDEMPVLWELAMQVLDALGRDPAVLHPFDGNLESWLSYLATPQPWLSEAENLRNRADYFDISTASSP